MVVPSEYALMLEPFKAVIAKHGKKSQSMLAYIYFMRDPRSIYTGTSEKERHVLVTTALFPGENFKPDKTVNDALDFYVSNETSVMKLLRSARESMDKLQKWMQDIDVTDEDYDPVKHIKVLESMGKTVDSIKKLEEAAQKESEESTTYGGVELNQWSRD